MNNLVFVTQNLHKVSDVQRLMPDFAIRHIDFVVPEIQLFVPKEIVQHKLTYAYNEVQHSLVRMGG